MSLKDIFQEFKEKDKAAELGGGEKAIEKQKNAGKQTARERIDMLLDDNTFAEIDKFVLHDSHNYNMQNKRMPGDGVVAGYGKIEGRLVYVYAYDFTVYGGSLSRTNANKIIKVQKLALKNGALGAKITGSGMGGCTLALCETEAVAKHVEEEIKAHGAENVWIFDLKELA